MNDVPWRLNKLLAGAAFRAKLKKLPFDLNIEYLIELWDKTEGICPITNRKLVVASSGVKGQVHPNAPSLDRIIPSKGYTIGNVRIITYHANVAISEFGYDAVINLAKDIISVAFR